MIHPPSLRQWRYLVALAERRHFGKAAEACLVTQSTLSAGIQELENQLQAALVDRTKRKTVLTPLGQTLAARARELLAYADEMVLLARSAAEPLSGPLHLGVIPTVSPFLLPRALPGIRKRFPKLKLYLREDLTQRIVEQLEAGTLDLLLLALPFEGGALETMTLFEDPFLLACPRGHALAQQMAVPLRALEGENLLLLEDGHCLRDHALAACRLAPRRADFAATSLHTLVQMVESGLGTTLLPQLAVESGILRGTNLVTRPLEAPGRGRPAPARRIGLAWRRGTQRAEEFTAFGLALKAALGNNGTSSLKEKI